MPSRRPRASRRVLWMWHDLGSAVDCVMRFDEVELQEAFYQCLLLVPVISTRTMVGAMMYCN